MRRPVHTVRAVAPPASGVDTSMAGRPAQSSPWSGRASPPYTGTSAGRLHGAIVGKHSSYPPVSAVAPYDAPSSGVRYGSLSLRHSHSRPPIDIDAIFPPSAGMIV